MWTQEVAPERLAELFHHYQRALLPEVVQKGSGDPDSWKEMPAQKKNRLVAAARLTLLELESVSKPMVSREFFSQPGQAEWGC
jgi:hypothetical protein